MHPATPDYIALLQGLAIFGGIRRDIVELILERSPVIVRHQGEYFFREGEMADSMYVLETGTVAVIKGWGEHQYLLRRRNEGDSIGEQALIDMQPRNASAIAETECLAIEIDTSTFEEIYHRDLEQFTLIQMNMAREISRRLRHTDHELFRLGVKGLVPEELPLYAGPRHAVPNSPPGG